MKIFEKDNINNIYKQIDPISRLTEHTLLLCIDFYEFFIIFHPSGSPISPHLLCYRAFAVAYYSFTPCALQLRRNRQLQILGFTALAGERFGRLSGGLTKKVW